MNRIDPKLAATLRRPDELVARGLASSADLPELEKVAARYAVAVTPEIAALIDPENPADPIARQFIPSAQELTTVPGENADPIGDDAHSPVAGIVHRYPDRVLFKLVHVCAVYCRFCFRREMVGPGKATALSDDAYQAALDYARRWGFVDAFRRFNEESKQYTWWNYREGAFQRDNGLRIDFIWISPALAKKCTRCWIDRNPRSWERPSDHVPVVAEFAL